MDIENDEVIDSDQLERLAVDDASDVELSDELQESSVVNQRRFRDPPFKTRQCINESFIIMAKEYTTLKCEVCCIMTRGVGNKDEFINYVKEGILLADSNYKGYTKMCNLLVDWMKEFHHPKTVHVLSCLLLLLDSIFMEEVKKALIQLKPHEDPTIVDNAIREVMSSCGDLPMTASSQKLLNVSKFDSYVRRRRDIQVLCSLFQDITCHHTYVYYIHHTKERLQKHVSDNEKDYRDHVNRFCEFCCKNELHYLRTRCLFMFAKVA
ncbi:hypothetical protein RFI_28111 [Reticulomyxa filosa]|uniref:Uncharacterized protein n=1 Tax=Reticulomyxa filosa TaxID=46433 RepID=X6M730_RETFI|nr:hypothetical protein RFI_28111 [Reticulomyxa filosa]|eukprot:ETO09277.1 hypothetical protein RFI_28111 [Reticulomyxa filosa]